MLHFWDSEAKKKQSDDDAKRYQELKDAIEAIEAKAEWERTTEEAEQLAEHYEAKKKQSDYDAKRYQVQKDAIEAIEAKAESERTTEEAEQLAEHYEAKKRKADYDVKKYQKKKQQLSSNTEEGKKYVTTFVDSLMNLCNGKNLVTELRSNIAVKKLRSFIKKYKLGVSFSNPAWNAIKIALSAALKDPKPASRKRKSAGADLDECAPTSLDEDEISFALGLGESFIDRMVSDEIAHDNSLESVEKPTRLPLKKRWIQQALNDNVDIELIPLQEDVPSSEELISIN